MQHHSMMPHARMLAIAAGFGSSVLLCACGDSDSLTSTPVTPAALTLKGTAATGLAMAGATVAIKCSGGDATVTTASDGSYTASLTGAALPCMVRATSSDGTLVYHAALNAGSSSATSAVINATPLTELLLALALGDPTQVDTTFTANATLPASVAANLPAAQTTLSTTLSAAGISLSGIDPVSTALTAATSTSSSTDTQDKAIDALMANLVANKSSLTELATVLTTGVSSAQVQQEVSTLLAAAPAVSQCANARAGTYWWMNHNGSLTQITLDTTHATVTVADVSENNGANPETDALTWGTGCQASFTQANTASQQVTFASGGEFAAGNLPTSSISSAFHLALPVQKVALSALAGAWNAIEYDSRVTTGASATATQLDTFTLDAAGNVTCTSGCTGSSTLAANTDGSFTRTVTSGSTTRTDRVIVYRGANGQLNFADLINYPNRGGLIIGVPAAALSLPAINTTSNYVQLQFSGIPSSNSTANWYTFTIDTFTYTISAVDSTNAAVTRSYSTKDSASYDLVDVLDYNKPSAGFRMRPGLTYTDASGVTYTKPTSYTLPLATGMSVFADGVAGQYSSATATSTASPFFGVSISLN